MEISKKLKKLIFKYLLKDLYKVEIIYYRDSVWFIDRENRHWYFEYHKVDKHLWWRWSHFTTALTIFSMGAEQEQHLFGELVNMILTKKQKLEAKYPNKVFKTVGSVMNFDDNDEVVTKNEIKTTDGYGWKPKPVVDEVLNCEVETTESQLFVPGVMVAEILNCEVKTTSGERGYGAKWVDEVLNCEVETTGFVSGPRDISMDEVLDSDVKISSGELIYENEMMNKVLEIQNIQPTERGANDMVDFVLDIGSNSINFDTTSQQGRVDGVLKNN